MERTSGFEYKEEDHLKMLLSGTPSGTLGHSFSNHWFGAGRTANCTYTIVLNGPGNPIFSKPTYFPLDLIYNFGNDKVHK